MNDKYVIGNLTYKNLLDNILDGVYFVDRDRKITYWNKGAERITGYESSDVVGSYCCDNLLNPVDVDGNELCLDACPLSKAMREKKRVERDMFLSHKDGYRVPVSVRTSPIYDEDGDIIGALEIFSETPDRSSALDKINNLELQAFSDPLTGLANRRYMENILESHLEELNRINFSFGILFIDIDNFKATNDRYGHEVGDKVLQVMSRTLKESLRAIDEAARWGGEEFIVSISNVNRAQLYQAAERIRMLVTKSKIPLPEEHEIDATVSIGATVATEKDTVSSLVKRADRLMYQSKEAGRDKVTIDKH